MQFKTSLQSTGSAEGLEISRGSLATFELASQREWLVTNGLGGFAAGTIADVNTRRYHGLLVAALDPPLGRVVMLSKLDAVVRYQGVSYALSSNEFDDRSIDPRGYCHLERFYLLEGMPVWEYAVADAVVEKRVIMPHGKNTTLVRFTVLRADSELELSLRPLCTHRDYHSHGQGGWDFKTLAVQNGFRINAYPGAQPYFVCTGGSAKVRESSGWYWRFRHRVEAERGLDESEDLFSPGLFEARVVQGEALIVAISTDSVGEPSFDQALEDETDRRHKLFEGLSKPIEQEWVKQLVYAADQFVVSRGSDSESDGRTVIAGYPWFGDWGRDTMIALPGLTLTTGRTEVAKSILQTFARYIDKGMLPNRFPDHGEAPEYNTVDATLWFVNAIHEYSRSSGQLDLAEEVFDALIDIVEWHNRGTRFGIHVDPDDGLLWAGQPGVQLTWMDAKVGDWVVTPRMGKAVEVNALWYNALQCIAELAKRFGRISVAADCTDAAGKVSANFSQFWNKKQNCLFDVIHGPEGIEGSDGRRYDGSIRPNQIFSVSLPYSPISTEVQRAVVDTCARDLVTSHGLRSLSKDSADYEGRYAGDQRQRDGSYHQGTVWGWLLGPFAEAHYRVYRDAEVARSFLMPLGRHLRDACVGSISEIFDGDPPHVAHGCFAQAWSVSETLRVWVALSGREGGVESFRNAK